MTGEWIVATMGKIIIVCMLIAAWNLIKWAARKIKQSVTGEEDIEWIEAE